MTSATLIARPERPAPTALPDPTRTYTCPKCGHVLRISGLGRHRVYFELDGERSVELDEERLADAVMNRVCPACGHGLPGKNPA